MNITSMTGKNRFYSALFFSILFFSVAAAVAAGEEKTGSVKDGALNPGKIRKVGIVVSAGSHFTNYGRFLIFPFRKGAQTAAWAVDENGKFAGTIFVTEKTARENWISAPEEGRPESLPVWSHAAADGLPVDAVSAATKDVSDDEYFMPFMELPPGRYEIFLEVNISYDWNSVWGKNVGRESPYYNGVNGQPSLVYQASLDLSDKLPAGNSNIRLHPVGTGHPLGLDGRIYKSFDGIDTAFSIIESAFVSVEND